MKIQTYLQHCSRADNEAEVSEFPLIVSARDRDPFASKAGLRPRVVGRSSRGSRSSTYSRARTVRVARRRRRQRS